VKKGLVIALAVLMILGLSGLAMAGDNVGDVIQNGNNNDAEIEQTGHNKASITQVGDQNDGNIYQNGTNFPSSGGCWYYLGAYIEQLGDKNEASIYMPTGDNATRIQQVGNQNEASQVLGSHAHKSTNWNRLGLHIKQFGNRNVADQQTISNFGCYGIQDMFAKQVGNDNFVDQLSIGGMQCLMEAYQIGNGNSSWQYQNARFSDLHLYIAGDNNLTNQYQEYTDWGASGDHDAYVDIYGNENEVRQTQIGEYDFADVDVNGNRNFVKQGQFGNSNRALVDIDGNNNGSACYACNNCYWFNTHGYTQYQNGENNYAEMDIFGSNNNACQWQDGDSNEADIDLIGNNNCVRQVQEGDSNWAKIYVNGNSNVACQYQDGGDISTITVTGYDNYACVVQN